MVPDQTKVVFETLNDRKVLEIPLIVLSNTRSAKIDAD
jgi:hypothetical protein